MTQGSQWNAVTVVAVSTVSSGMSSMRVGSLATFAKKS